MPTETIGEWEERTGYERTADQIESLPETAEPVVELEPVEEIVVLLERSCGGWRTELRLTADGEPAILVQQGFDGPTFGTLVPRDRALDAFDHPYCYLKGTS